MHPAQAGDDPDGFARFHRRRRALPAPAGATAARPRASADRLGLRAGARQEALAERADLPPSRASTSPAAISMRQAPSTIRATRWLPAISAGRLVRQALARDHRCPPLPRQRARPDPHLQGPPPHAARSRSTTSISATCNGRISPPAASAAACAGRTGIPHTLTAGMRRAQRALARLPAADGLAALPPRQPERGDRDATRISPPSAAAMRGRPWSGCCGAGRCCRMAGWMPGSRRVPATLRLPGLAPGHYRIALWDTQKGIPVGSLTAPSLGNGMLSTRLPPFSGDIAIAIRPD